jgi:hypothetical protein
MDRAEFGRKVRSYRRPCFAGSFIQHIFLANRAKKWEFSSPALGYREMVVHQAATETPWNASRLPTRSISLHRRLCGATGLRRRAGRMAASSRPDFAAGAIAGPVREYAGRRRASELDRFTVSGRR